VSTSPTAATKLGGVPIIVYLDTNIVIYVVEQNPVHGPKVRTRLATARAAGDILMISDLTRMECLVGPLKSGDAAVEADFHTPFGVTNVVAIDALQLAAAVEHGASVFLTADGRLSSFTGLAVEVLS